MGPFRRRRHGALRALVLLALCVLAQRAHTQDEEPPGSALEQARTALQQCAEGIARGCQSLDFLAREASDDGELPGKLLRPEQVGCDAENAGACNRLGVLHARGIGVQKDSGRAAELYQRACDGEDGRGCRNLGLAYKEGLGVRRDTRRSRSLLERACRQQVGDACELLREASGGDVRGPSRADEAVLRVLREDRQVGSALTPEQARAREILAARTDLSRTGIAERLRSTTRELDALRTEAATERALIERMQAIPLDDAPPDFRSAYARHTAAWAQKAEQLESCARANARVLEAFRSGGDETRDCVAEGLSDFTRADADVAATFADLLRIARRLGVDLTEFGARPTQRERDAEPARRETTSSEPSPATAPAPARPSDVEGIYLVAGAGASRSRPYLLLRDGSIYRNVGDGPAALDRKRSLREENRAWGRWRREGTSLAVRWSDGSSETWSKGSSGAPAGWFLGIPAQPGERLDGVYRATGDGIGIPRASAGAIHFHPDGRFELEAPTDASPAQMTSGTYRLDGYSILLEFSNGTSQQRAFYFAPDREGFRDGRGIGLGGASLQKQRAPDE